MSSARRRLLLVVALLGTPLLPSCLVRELWRDGRSEHSEWLVEGPEPHVSGHTVWLETTPAVRVLCPALPEHAPWLLVRIDDASRAGDAARAELEALPIPDGTRRFTLIGTFDGGPPTHAVELRRDGFGVRAGCAVTPAPPPPPEALSGQFAVHGLEARTRRDDDVPTWAKVMLTPGAVLMDALVMPFVVAFGGW